jgi:hypothetical protein
MRDPAIQSFSARARTLALVASPLDGVLTLSLRTKGGHDEIGRM